MSLPELRKRLKKLEEKEERLETRLLYVRKEIKEVKLQIFTYELKDAWNKASSDMKWTIQYKDETWYVFPYSRYKKDRDSLGQHYYVISDLKQHVIYSKHSYEGRRCKRGWAVDAYYIQWDEQVKAVKMYSERYR